MPEAPSTDARVSIRCKQREAATLTLLAKAKRSLSGEHLTLKAQRPATRRKSAYALPDSSGT